MIDPGAGYDSAGGYYSRDVSYRPWMEDEKRSSQPSHSWGPVRCSEWPYQAALPCHVIIELLRPFRGHIISGGANHGGTMPKRWAKERRKGGKGRAGCCAAQRTHANEQPLARPAGQPREGRQNFRASHIPRGRPRVAGWVKVRGTRCRDGQVDGSSEEFQVSCLGCGVSRFDAGSARARPEATQRNEGRTPHARRGTSTPLQLQCVALHPLARLALTLTLISQQNRTTGPHLSHLCLQRLGLPMRRSGAPASRGLELSRQRWGSHRGLEFWLRIS